MSGRMLTLNATFTVPVSDRSVRALVTVTDMPDGDVRVDVHTYDDCQPIGLLTFSPAMVERLHRHLGRWQTDQHLRRSGHAGGQEAS